MDNVVHDNNYLRFNNQYSNDLKQKIKKLYNNDESNVILTNSGLHASSVILEILNIYYNKKLFGVKKN